MNRLLEIAIALKALYTRRAGLEFDLLIVEGEVNTCKIILTPEEGWPGKNDTERNAVRDRTFLNSDALQHNILWARDLRGELLMAEAEIAGLEAERRALEWEVREKMAADVESLDLGMFLTDVPESASKAEG